MRRICFLDIKEGELLRYTVDMKGKHCVITEQQAFPLPDANEMPADAVSKEGETIYVSLPVGSLNFRVLDLPFSDTDRIREVLPFELDSLILGGSEGVICDAVVVGKTDNGYRVLATYMEKSRMRKLLERLKDLGAEPVLVTSLELRHVLSEFSLAKLVSPISLADDERKTLAIEEMRNPTVNLRRDREKTKRSLKVTATLLALLLLVLGIDVAFRIVTSRQEVASLRNEIRKTYLELFPGEKNIINEIHQLKSHIKELKNKEELLVGVKPLDVFVALAQIERDGARFYEVNIERGKLSFRGEAGSLSSVQQIRERLNKYFDDVSISASETSVQGTTAFTITARERKA